MKYCFLIVIKCVELCEVLKIITVIFLSTVEELVYLLTVNCEYIRIKCGIPFISAAHNDSQYVFCFIFYIFHIHLFCIPKNSSVL